MPRPNKTPLKIALKGVDAKPEDRARRLKFEGFDFLVATLIKHVAAYLVDLIVRLFVFKHRIPVRHPPKNCPDPVR